jgi:hypothetical protein
MADEAYDLIPEDYLTGRALPQEMVEAFQVIAGLESKTVNDIDAYLSSFRELKTSKEVRGEIANLLPEPDSDDADIIVRTLLNIQPSAATKTLTILDRWRRSSARRLSLFPDDLFERLTANLGVLAKPQASLTLLRKSEYLLRAVGNELDEIMYICDLRPVFDRTRKNVDGFVILANLMMKYRNQQGAQQLLELSLTEDDLQDLIKASTKAMEKIEVLRDSIALISGTSRE